MRSYVFKDVFINNFYTMIAKSEYTPSFIKKIDFVYKDYYVEGKSIEETEAWFQTLALDGLLKKINKKDSEINLLLAGDLNNQLFSSCFNASLFNMPFLGLFSACATFVQGLIISSCLIEKDFVKNSIVLSSSHNLVNEKQFRFPIEYGAVKKKTSSFSATGSSSAYLSKEKGKIKIESATIGKVIDLNYKDADNMGSAMAPAAAEVLKDHLISLDREISYYDLILTGDLGVYGVEVFKEYLKRKYEIKVKKVLDAGEMLYNAKKHGDFTGGSGPICVPLVLFNKIIDESKYKKILVIATGSLHSVLSTNLKKGLPVIAHAISLEVEK